MDRQSDGASSATASGSGCTVVCLGDSLTFGMGVVDPDHDAWPALLQDKLGDGCRVANLGVSGTTLMDECHAPYRKTGKIDQALTYDYTHVIVMIGSNDAFDPAWDVASYRRQLAALVDEVRAGRPETVRVFLMAPTAVFFGRDRYVRDHVEEGIVGGVLRSAVRSVAEEKGTGYIDMYAFTEDHLEWFPDLLHPDEAGNRAMADYVYECVFG